MSELQHGAEKSQARTKALAATAARHAGDAFDAHGSPTLRANPRGAGARRTPIGNNDLWIAAHARAEGWVLITNNEREFCRVDGLVVENRATPA